MHVFPQLRKLERKYAAELQVIGVHSAKFTAEKDTQNVRKAILRYDIEHPVVNDYDFDIVGDGRQASKERLFAIEGRDL